MNIAINMSDLDKFIILLSIVGLDVMILGQM